MNFFALVRQALKGENVFRVFERLLSRPKLSRAGRVCGARASCTPKYRLQWRDLSSLSITQFILGRGAGMLRLGVALVAVVH